MLNITVTGIDNVVSELKAIRDTLRERVRSLAERLLNEGYSIAQVKFADALDAGSHDVRVLAPVWEGDTLVLRAEGNSVVFLEFGTGTFYEEHPDPSMRSKIGAVGRGEYEKKKGAKPPWIYLGEAGDLGEVIAYKQSTGEPIVKTYGNPPARAMYDASKVLDKDHVMQIAKEVFR